MTKSTVAASAAVAATAAVAQESGAPAVKNPMAGPIFDRLHAAGAVLVPMASKGFLHQHITSKLPASTPIAEVGAKARELAKSADWGSFNFGYFIGERASYSACAASAGQKKAKKDSAFVWAALGKDKKSVVLYTSTGNVWSRPAQAGRLQSDYDRAEASAKAALGVK